MADAAVDFLLSNLTKLLVYNAQLIAGVKSQVESLCDELRLMAAFVKQENMNNNSITKELVRRIRIEVFKAEDIIDTYVSTVTLQKSRAFPQKAYHVVGHLGTSQTLGKEIEDIQNRLQKLYDHKLIMNQVPQNMGSFTSRPSPHVEEDNVVGFGKEVKKVSGWLIADTKELEVISIVGMGGLGKTTLVKKIFNDPSVRFKFSMRSWVYVSQVYNRRELLLGILYDVTQESKDRSHSSVDAIATELHHKLEEMKYLIVLDDVWTKLAWDDLRGAFPNTKTGSRILLTTRNNDVAEHAKMKLPPYPLCFLTDDKSWELLEQKVFPKGTRCPIELVDLGKQIAKKCHGLPLALVVIGGVLRKKDKTFAWWEKIVEKVNTYVAMEHEQCMDVLALSYDHLPHNLKACFLYFGIFPEDYEIPVRKLMHIWVAEGIIQLIGDATAEEMAEENLQDLVDRSLVLVEKRRGNGGIKTCRIHDMLHDMCVIRAEEENFFKVTKGLQTSPYISVDPNVFRRVSVHSRVSDYFSRKPDSTHVRSFLCYGKEEEDVVTDFLGSFKLLRILDVRAISFPRFPTVQLVHLRYIAVLGTFTNLPKAISNLWNLQTLIVNTNGRNINIKADVWKLVHLRHVYTSAASHFPTPSSKIQKVININLRTMSKVSPHTCTDVILARMPNLQKLGVRGSLNSLFEEIQGSSKFDNISKLNVLEKLKLLNDTFPIPLLDGKLHALPQWYKFPPKLKKLTMSKTMLDWDHMLVLSKLPGLEVLKLEHNAFMGQHWETSYGGFVNLRVLQISNTNLVKWDAFGHQFPQLQRVSLNHCKQLLSMPSGLGDIPMLELVEMTWTSRSAVASANQINKKFKLLVFPPDQDTQV